MKSKIIAVSALLLLGLGHCAYAQQTVRGKVVDSEGVPLPGASVIIQNTTIGVLTDFDGLYSISCSSADVLEFASMGYKTAYEKVGKRTVINVTLADDSSFLEEAVVVGYGTQAKANLTNAVSSVKGAELLKAPAVGVSSMVGTRVAGVVALQQSGQPGSDAASLLVRGQGAVCIVDGVKRNLNEIDPNDVESISVLKDATSASMYGLDATSVILVTTKRGDAQRTRISYNGEFGISRNTNMLRLLNGPEYAYWYNECTRLDADAKGLDFNPDTDLIFTKQNVQDMLDGTNGWGNTDWYSKTFGTGTTQHHTISASGGNEKSKFFASIGYFDQNGNVDNFNYSRYSVRSNVDTKINDFLSFEMNLAGRLEIRDEPGYAADANSFNNIPMQAVRSKPYLPETVEIDGVTYPVSSRPNTGLVSPLASATESGNYNIRNSYIETSAVLRYDVPFVPGLYFKAMGSYDMFFQNTRRLAVPYKTAAEVIPAIGTTVMKYNVVTDARGTSTYLAEGSHNSYTITTNLSANYEREFGKHAVKALAFMETREVKGHTIGATGYGLDFLSLSELDKVTNKTGDGSEKIPAIAGRSSHSRAVGFAGRINYSYAQKYLLELSCRYDGSYIFANKAGSRWVVLPGVSLGWNIHKEDWFNAPWVNELKLRASAGKSATSNGLGSTNYLDLFGLSQNSLVLGGVNQGMVYASVLGNPNLTWAKINSYDIGVDFEAWRGLLGLELDVFYKYEYDILSGVTGSYSPSRGGYYYTYGNDNKKDYRGFDFTIRHNNYIGDLNYGAKLMFTYAYRRWLFYAGDSANTPMYQRLTGKEVGSRWGFLSDGLFTSWTDVENSASPEGYAVAPGYIKYVDRNGDGKVVWQDDQGYVAGTDYPRVQGSLNLYANWKGFDIDLLFQGAMGRTVSLTGQYTLAGSEGIQDNTFLTKPFYGGGNTPLFLLEHAWTPNNPDGEFPRPAINSLSNNNGFSSTFWYRDGSYLRLKTMQIGYTIPAKITKRAGVSSLRIYVQGSNLFTISELTKYNIDPEQPAVNNGYYPQQKVYQLGAKLTF